MQMRTLEEYRAEFAAHGIDNLLYQLILDIVAVVAPTYPARRYVLRPSWDADVIADICQEYTLTRLLQTPRLEYFLLTADTPDALRRLISRDFRQFLISRRQRTEYSNLFQRVRTLLLSNPQRFYSPSSGRPVAHAIWGLAGWGQREEVQDINEVLSAMAVVKLPPLIIYRPDSERHSHLVTTDDLSQLLEETLTTLGRWLRLQLMMDGLRYRLNLIEAEAVSLDDMVERTEAYESHPALSASTFESPDKVVPLRQAAEEIFDRLTDRQREVLALRLTPPDLTLEQIGRQVGTSKSTVANELVAIERIVRASELDVAEGEPVLAYLVELCEQAIKRSRPHTDNTWP